MLKKYRTVFEGSEGEITEKKSRFIATVLPVHSEEEAIGFIEQMRKKYWNATHNCFAYVIGEHFEIKRFSDYGKTGVTEGKTEGTNGQSKLESGDMCYFADIDGKIEIFPIG